MLKVLIVMFARKISKVNPILIYTKKEFAQKSHLNRHMLTHTKEKPYKCNQCDKSFTLKQAVKRQLLIHTGKREFKCEFCEKKLSQK